MPNPGLGSARNGRSVAPERPGRRRKGQVAVNLEAALVTVTRMCPFAPETAARSTTAAFVGLLRRAAAKAMPVRSRSFSPSAGAVSHCQCHGRLFLMLRAFETASVARTRSPTQDTNDARQLTTSHARCPAPVTRPPAISPCPVSLLPVLAWRAPNSSPFTRPTAMLLLIQSMLCPRMPPTARRSSLAQLAVGCRSRCAYFAYALAEWNPP